MNLEEAKRLMNKYELGYSELLDLVSSRPGWTRRETVITVVLQLKIDMLEERIEELESEKEVNKNAENY